MNRGRHIVDVGVDVGVDVDAAGALVVADRSTHVIRHWLGSPRPT